MGCMGTKSVLLTLTEREHSELKDVKGDRNWEEAVLEEFGVSNE